MTIEIAHIRINLELFYESYFHNIKDYEVNGYGKYTIRSSVEHCLIPHHKIKETEFFDVYEDEHGTYQVQMQNGVPIGILHYFNETITVYLLKNDFQTEYLLSQYALVYILNQEKQALFIHGSSIVYHQKGLLFCAKSGTGKSTHTGLWRKYTDAVYLNDDKNIVLIEEDKLMLYPNPWSGKHQLNQNIVAPLEGIIFLYQSKGNKIKKLTELEIMRLLLGQIDPPNKKNLEHWNKVVDAILKLPAYLYGCNMEEDAVITLKQRLEMDLCL